MLNVERKTIPRFAVLFLIGGMLLFFPLVRDFHFESALMASLVGCFWAGIRGCKKASNKTDFIEALTIAGYLFVAGIPLFVNALLTDCFSIDGLAFWLLFPLPSVFFGFATGRIVKGFRLSYPRTVVAGILGAIGVGIFLYELLSYPQVYFFNHVWGGWPGPIYDETVGIDEGTVFFRSLTMLWALLLWNLPTIKGDQYSKWFVGLASIAIMIGYTQLTEFGIISPRSYLQNVLGGHKSTDHFELYYDRQLYSDYEIELLAKEHEFYLKQISDRLALPPRDSTKKIESYLYGHAWQKKQMVGAKFTSYVPVWLEQDQLHIAKQQIESSLKHELVHVLAKQFGNELFNASWSIGLIEGIAVAIEGGSSTSTVDQIVVSEKPYPTTEELKRAFSISGFYGGRSGVNYITSGSFVNFLMDNYSIDALKKAYKTGNIRDSYSLSWQTLTSEWYQHLETVQVDSIDRQVASRIFSIPSLFEKPCPHMISDFASTWDTFRFHLANRDTTEAIQALNRAVAVGDSVSLVKTEWSYRNLMAGYPSRVQEAASLQDTTVELQLLYADAFALTNNMKQAQSHLGQAQKLYASKPDSLTKPAVETRLDTRQWEVYREVTYHNSMPDSATFSNAYYRTKIRSLRKALNLERWSKVEQYAGQLLDEPVEIQYFDDFRQLIHSMAFLGEFRLAERLMNKLSKLPLRERFQDRLNQERAWMNFLESKWYYS